MAVFGNSFRGLTKVKATGRLREPTRELKEQMWDAADEEHERAD